jgi:hypothetical protein
MSGTCKRPNCPYDAQKDSRGYCGKHYTSHRLSHPPQDAEPIVAHIEAIRATGVGLRCIAELTGVGERTLSGIVRGQRRYVYHETAEAILALPVPDIPHNMAKDGARVSAAGTTRRLRALTALGYTQPALSKLIGTQHCDVWRYLYGHREYVHAGTARKVAAVMKQVETLPPPTGWAADRARERAVARGWLPPIAWDDTTIDDPAADPGDVLRKPSLRVSGPDFVAEYLDLRDFLELSDERIAERLGITEDAVRLRLKRSGFGTAGDDETEVAS